MSAVLSTHHINRHRRDLRYQKPTPQKDKFQVIVTHSPLCPDFSATGSNPEEVVSFGLREVIRKQRIVSRVCVYSPDLCHKVSRLSRIGMLSLLTEPCSE
ncbi:hypothetical protein F7725_010088 [Dissostichus mawsoni]|uniref:Uncharacterized protein n=1 Tax=Dissostichus mawsoni TaxID=36200 RepID=A0A7J5XMV0_DISMA|nr:hypothetical protein F7725_010088 [Dissostichus mawsoni]